MRIKRSATPAAANPRSQIGAAVARWAIAGLISLAFGCSSIPAGQRADPGSVVRIAALAPEPSAAVEELSTEQALQLRLAERTLLSQAADVRPEDRRDAARLLLALDVAQANEVLIRGLESPNEDILASIVTAMETSPLYPPSLLNPLVKALQRSPARLWDAMGRVVSRYGEAAATALGAPARNRTLPVNERLAVIHGLGAALSPDTAEQLISVLSDAQTEDPVIVDATCESLERMTGVQHGRDPVLWLNWWAANQDRSPTEWQQLYTHSLRTRVGELQQQLQQERKARTDAATRLTEALRELFGYLPPAQQLTRLPAMLSDPMPEVREFAFSRIDQRQRDSEPIPEDIQHKLVERLDDPVARLRARAAQQLDLANHPELVEALYERLAAQTDPDVVSQWLTILGKRHATDAFEPALQQLRSSPSPAVMDAAAGVIWSLAEARHLSASQQAASVAVSREAMDRRTSPALQRVIAAMGTTDEAQRLVGELQSTDAAVRAAVAQGLAWRNWSEPLLRHASDPAVYPHALKLVASRTPVEQTLRALLDLPPPTTDLAPRWQQAVMAVAAGMSLSDLLMVDDLLESSASADIELRIGVLRRVLDARTNGLDPEAHARLLLRLATLLVDKGLAVQAHEALQRLPEIVLTEDQVQLRLNVALLAGSYDRAAEIDDSPRAWIDCLWDLLNRNIAAARALREEIRQRFGGSLSGDALEQFEAACARLDAERAEPARSPGGPGT